MELKLEACAWIGTHEGLDIRIDRVFDGEKYVFRSYASRSEKSYDGDRLGAIGSAYSGPCESYEEAYSKLRSCVLRVIGKEVERRGRWTRRDFTATYDRLETWVLDGGEVVLHKRQAMNSSEKELFTWEHIASRAVGTEFSWEKATMLAETISERLKGVFPPTVWTPHVAP